jgi:CrcB protein
MLGKLAALAAAGALGTLARYGLSGLVQRGLGASFPWGTLAVNALGCLAFGVFWAAAGQRLISGEMRTIVLIGFMGAFTTFSTLAAESGQLLADREWAMALANVLLHNVGGIVLFFAGAALGRLL